MGNGQAARVSLWREGLRAFTANRQEWLRLVPWFFVISAIAYFFLLREFGPFHAAFMEALKNYKGEELQAHLKTLPKMNHLHNLVLTFTLIVQTYFFTVFYLRRAPILAAPARSIDGFFYALMKGFLKYAAVVGLGFVADLVLLIPLVIAQVVAKKNGHDMPLLLFCAVPFSLLVTWYLMTRYAFVYPLAVEGVTSSLKRSAAVTRGNILRLIGNFLALFVILLPLWIISLVITYSASSYWDNLLVTALLAVVLGVIQIVTGGIYTAYQCAACRILYQEKKKADPTFVLTTQTR